MERTLDAELLDSLPATDPEARRSRRDLRLINTLMGNGRWFRRELQRHVRADDAILEIGAGDGDLRKMTAPETSYAGLDLAPRPEDWPGGAAWHQADARNFDGWAAFPIICGNLVFHHFTEEELSYLGARLKRSARVILASEPARAARWQRLFGALCPLLRASPVTRHDGRVSIAAGFTGDELPRWLGLTRADGWDCAVGCSGLGAYRMRAIRS